MHIKNSFLLVLQKNKYSQFPNYFLKDKNMCCVMASQKCVLGLINFILPSMRTSNQTTLWSFSRVVTPQVLPRVQIIEVPAVLASTRVKGQLMIFEANYFLILVAWIICYSFLDGNENLKKYIWIICASGIMSQKVL